MNLGQIKWDITDMANAMEISINENAHPKYLKKRGDILVFNGFWRNGDKQNVCAWLNKATWHDAKTGDGGGCKEFAKIAFNMTLLEFMTRFGQIINVNATTLDLTKIFNLAKEPSNKSINNIWLAIQHQSLKEPCKATKWLEEERGFNKAKKLIGSGFLSLEKNYISCFPTIHHHFLHHRLSIGSQLLIPLRSVDSDEVKNIVFRTITPCDKNDKTRLLPHAGGWAEKNGSPRAFGFPYLIHDFPNIVLCEGMADYFAAEYLLEESEKYLPLGASNADALVKWAHWLVNNSYNGHIHIIYQLDKDNNGNLSKKTIGPNKALNAWATMSKNGLKAYLFDWLKYLDNFKSNPQEINDLADSIKHEKTYHESSLDNLQNIFLSLLKYKENN